MKSHVVPSQVGVLFAGGVHAAHDVPQVATEEFDAQSLLHAWNPESQTMEQLPALQAACPFAVGEGHRVEQAPQFAVDVLVSAHSVPHKVSPGMQDDEH